VRTGKKQLERVRGLLETTRYAASRGASPLGHLWFAGGTAIYCGLNIRNGEEGRPPTFDGLRTRAGDHMQEPSEEQIRQHLDSLVGSDCLSKSVTSQRLLSYLVHRSLSGAEGPKETEIAIDVFGRDVSFNGGDDSVVRVAMRGLRQKLVEYYAGPGRDDALAFEIPKGSYRLAVTRRQRAAEAPVQAAERSTSALAEAPAPRRSWGPAAAVATALLCLSLALNLYVWLRPPPVEPEQAGIRSSALWKDIVASRRPVMFVLGDLFMYTQSDPVTGRTQTVRDPQINSSDDLRAFLATQPQLAAERGLRYASYVQKSTAAGMAAIIPIITGSPRPTEVRLRDELRAEDLQRYDIIYLGPISRIGPLDGSFYGHSRYRFDAPSSVLTDVRTNQAYKPEGDLGGHHKDYALVSRFRGPAGNTIVVITAGGRNAGLQQVVRAVTTAEGLGLFDQRLRDAGADDADAFEALLEVTGYKQTDLSAGIVEIYATPRSDAAAPRSGVPESSPAPVISAN
jgi:hypothetical protein